MSAAGAAPELLHLPDYGNAAGVGDQHGKQKGRGQAGVQNDARTVFAHQVATVDQVDHRADAQWQDEDTADLADNLRLHRVEAEHRHDKPDQAGDGIGYGTGVRVSIWPLR